MVNSTIFKKKKKNSNATKYINLKELHIRFQETAMELMQDDVNNREILPPESNIYRYNVLVPVHQE